MKLHPRPIRTTVMLVILTCVLAACRAPLDPGIPQDGDTERETPDNQAWVGSAPLFT